MCLTNEIHGSGTVLLIQGLTLFSIAAAIIAWIVIYRKSGVDLGQYAIPIGLWILFGSLDALMTANGTFGNPLREENPLTRFALLQWGFWGMPLASFLWVSLWAGIVLVLNKRIAPAAARLPSLAIFYSLAVGHLFGFSSWYTPLCPIAELFPPLITSIPKIVLAGTAAAAVQFWISKKG